MLRSVEDGIEGVVKEKPGVRGENSCWATAQNWKEGHGQEGKAVNDLEWRHSGQHPARAGTRRQERVPEALGGSHAGRRTDDIGIGKGPTQLGDTGSRACQFWPRKEEESVWKMISRQNLRYLLSTA